MTDRTDELEVIGDRLAFAPASETAMKALCDGVAELLRVAPRPPGRLRVRLGDVSVDLTWPTAAPAGPADATTAAPPMPGPDSTEPATETLHQVVSPLVGTFYRAPQPGAKPFVEVGDTVFAGQQLGLLEAMKLLHPLEADRPGRVAAILADDAAPVQYGQPLIHIEPELDGEDADV
ncbi:biotin/lipoyl-containing protein [Actinoplanes sp. N902-109]|uniref:acetyl-CoA carboxylase biotin carboxyl carrier protein n=1 Tax=Actinoplanes sp. (strain N902-109) TaxID=649831 RepID=UPI00032967CE|nr:biotin/lipoyl-containing protein [Actinoplanes sp. N902-109]AGL16611.1 acetyl-CoA carboxylase, biotin carboxyl carrier protein [Actinoplanes sp. N902-109]